MRRRSRWLTNNYLAMKKMHNDYLKLNKQQTHFLSTRLKTRIKLRFKKDLLNKINDKKKLEKTVHRNINTTYQGSWLRISNLPYDQEYIPKTIQPTDWENYN